MGILDIFGGSPAQKAVKLKAKVTQKYGDAATRQKAIDQLGEMKIPEAVNTLLSRFTITVDPGTVDADEKDHVFQLIKAMGQDAVGPVTEFLRRSEQASSWALRLLHEMLPKEEVVGVVTELLAKLGTSYTRDPEKKTVLIQYVEGNPDPRVGPVLVPFLDDMSDDVKIAALKALAPLKYEPAREPMLTLLTSPETGRRVQQHVIPALAESGFGVQGFREKVEALVAEPYFVDKSGLVKKRG